MLKRTKGYFLLTMLVLTGLAGRTHTDVLSGKERRFLLNDLKIIKIDLLNNIQGLSKKQLDFRQTKNSLSIRDHLYRTAAVQITLWNNVQSSLLHHISIAPEKISMDDAQLNDCVNNDLETARIFNTKIHFHSVPEVLNNLKKENTEIIRYVRTATDNLRHHIVKTPVGNLDIFQTIIFISAYTKQSLQMIKEIKQSPGFPGN
ncbi:MAG TPA: hypothetical protein VGO09_09885 [Flavisolibacter sp.]|jgi:hypothetical protein|nr:hypothetical protein [Flavisolibacter sp.]